MKQQQKIPYRLALREEGLYWNAYYARIDTMQDAVWIGSIALRAIQDMPALQQRFIALMQDVISLSLKHIAGAEVSWPNPPQPAPESERSGNG